MSTGIRKLDPEGTTVGMAVGLALGIALGTAFGHVDVGLALGVAAGMVLGPAFSISLAKRQAGSVRSDDRP